MTEAETGKKKNAWVRKQVKGAVAGGLIGLKLAGVPGAVTGALVGSTVARQSDFLEAVNEAMRRGPGGPRRVHPDGTID